MSARVPEHSECSPLMGVYRLRRTIGGRPAWYAIDASGEIANFVVDDDDASEAAIVRELATLVYRHRMRILTLVCSEDL